MPAPNDIDRLLDAARRREMSPAEREQQRRSFAFGNANIENARITRRMVDEAADEIDRTI